MQMIEEYPNEFTERFYPQMSKQSRARNLSKGAKDKKKKPANDMEFNEIVGGLFDLLNEMNKHSKNAARKTKRNPKTRFEPNAGIESFEKLHKKQKLNPEKEYEEIPASPIREDNEWQTKVLAKGMIPRGEVPLLPQEDAKKDGKKPGLYRFKDEVDGDKDFQLKNLNLLFKKDEKSGERQDPPHDFPGQNPPNKQAMNEEPTQQAFGKPLTFFAEILKKIPNMPFEQASSTHYLNTLSMLSELLESKNEVFPPEGFDLLNYKSHLLASAQKPFSSLGFPNPLLNFNKSLFPFNISASPASVRTNHEKIIENIEDIKFMNQRNLATPFKRAGTHVAIAYYIYVNKNKNKFNDNKNNNECDPTYHARILRERKNPTNSPPHNQDNPPLFQEKGNEPTGIQQEGPAMKPEAVVNLEEKGEGQEKREKIEGLEKKERIEVEEPKNAGLSSPVEINAAGVSKEKPGEEESDSGEESNNCGNTEPNETSNLNSNNAGSQALENGKDQAAEDKKDPKLKKKKNKYFLDRSVDHTQKESLKFKIHLQKSESQFEEGVKSNDE